MGWVYRLKILQSLHNLLCDLGVHTQCAHMQHGQKGKNRPTKSIKMCAIEVERNSKSATLKKGVGVFLNVLSRINLFWG